MEKFEKEIGEAAEKYSIEKHGIPEIWEKIQITETLFDSNITNAFIVGAKSPEAKQYWQQGMYSEEEVLNLIRDAIEYGYNACYDKKGIGDVMINKWIEENKKK